MKHVKYNPDLSEWNLDSIEEVLKLAFEGDNTYIYFPARWSVPNEEEEWTGTDGIGGPQVDDPLTAYLMVDLGGWDCKPTFSFNIRDTLSDDIDQCAEDGSGLFWLGRMSEELRTLADEIDAARAKFKAGDI